MTAAQTHKPLGDHLEDAANLPKELWGDARRLADQLADVALLPLIGAGASIDCAGPSAGELSKRLAAAYEASVPTAERASDFESRKKEGDLGAMGDAHFQATGEDQVAVAEALGFTDTTLWPPVEKVPEHFCGYRVLARLAREGFLGEAMTLNYDCNFERGLKDEGFELSHYGLRGRAWLDHATVIADEAENASFDRRGAFVLTKAHGCSQRFRKMRPGDPQRAARSIVVRKGQLLDWRTDLWARDIVTERTRRHVLILIGFSGSDPVINVTLTRILEEVRDSGNAAGSRVVVIDKSPQTIALRGLVGAGSPKSTSGEPQVTALSSDGSSITAVLLALLVELLRIGLKQAAGELGYSLAEDPEELLGTLGLCAPQALRWAYLLAPPDPAQQHAQWINLEKAARDGYVPLASAPQRAVRALHTRRRLREELGFPATEPLTEITPDTFIAGRGKAYLATGLDREELDRARGAPLRNALSVLPFPRGLDPVLVGTEGSNLTGIAAMSGTAVDVP